MVDIERRKKLAFHFRQLAVGLISNDDFEKAIGNDVTNGWLPEQYYRSKRAKEDDAVMIPLLELAWGLYNDTKTHKLIKQYALTPEGLKVVARCILFLHSDKEYEWPACDEKFRIGLTDLLLMLLTLGISQRIRRTEQERLFNEWKTIGDHDVWPFFRMTDYEEQLKYQPFLNGAVT